MAIKRYSVLERCPKLAKDVKYKTQRLLLESFTHLFGAYRKNFHIGFRCDKNRICIVVWESYASSQHFLVLKLLIQKNLSCNSDLKQYFVTYWPISIINELISSDSAYTAYRSLNLKILLQTIMLVPTKLNCKILANKILLLRNVWRWKFGS